MAPIQVIQISHLTPPPQSNLQSLPLTHFDILFLSADPVERIFFYSIPSHSTRTNFTNSIVPKLESSLAQALNIFFPLYGKIRRSGDKFELSYAEGDSVPFVVAQLDGEDLDQLSSHDARKLDRLLPLRPKLQSDDESIPVLAIQVTLFPNQGIAIGTTVHHSACDGQSSTKFLSTWATICRTGTSSFSPLFDRTAIVDPQGLYSVYLRSAVGRPVIGPSEDMVSRTFSLSAGQIRRIKDVMPIRCSTVVVSYALMWVCTGRARRIPSDEAAHLVFVVSCSDGYRPPIPSDYFGNRLSGLFVQVSAGELLGQEGIVTAAKAINKMIEKFRENVFEGAEKLMDNWISVSSRRLPLSVAGSPKFRVYDVDFGWGKPKKVEMTMLWSSGSMSIADSGIEQGGIEIGFMLKEDEMNELAKQFDEAILVLSK